MWGKKYISLIHTLAFMNEYWTEWKRKEMSGTKYSFNEFCCVIGVLMKNLMNEKFYFLCILFVFKINLWWKTFWIESTLMEIKKKRQKR